MDHVLIPLSEKEEHIKNKMWRPVLVYEKQNLRPVTHRPRGRYMEIGGTLRRPPQQSFDAPLPVGRVVALRVFSRRKLERCRARRPRSPTSAPRLQVLRIIERFVANCRNLDRIGLGEIFDIQLAAELAIVPRQIGERDILP